MNRVFGSNLWLYSRARDVLMLLAPMIMTLAAYAVHTRFGLRSANAYAEWLAQFALGNSTHVILTFLLLGTCGDVRDAHPGQGRLVLVGSIGTFLVTVIALYVTAVVVPLFEMFVSCVIMVFAIHHTVAQARGIWTLYGLRASSAGCPPPTRIERRAMSIYVPLAVSLIASRWFFVAESETSIAFMPSFVDQPALLPSSSVLVLLGVWICFAGSLFLAVVRTRSGPKAFYVATHLIGVGVMIVTPKWGIVLTAGIHGLEYFFLSARMLASPTTADGNRRWVTGAIITTIAPLVIVGLLSAPFTSHWIADMNATWLRLARIALNGIITAHYFADAVIYRFRVPQIRRVTLARLGFA